MGKKEAAAGVEAPAGLLDAAARELTARLEETNWDIGNLQRGPAGKRLLALGPSAQVAVIDAALDRLAELEPKIAAYRKKHGDGFSPGWNKLWNPRRAMLETLRGLLRRKLPLAEGTLVRLARWTAADPEPIEPLWYPLPGLASAAEHFAESNAIGPQLADALRALIGKLRQDPHDKDCRMVADRLEALIAGGPQIQIEPGEAWSDAALADLAAMKAKARAAWYALLVHCQAGGKGKFTDRWRGAAEPLIGAVGFDSLKERGLRWFPLVDKPRTGPVEREHQWAPDWDNLIIAPHVELLRGLVWCCGLNEDADLARAVARLALSAYRKIPGKGPRLVSLGNACVTALGTMPGLPAVGQLAVLKVKVKFGTAQREIEKAFTASAQRAGLGRDDIEELAVPSYGLQEVGVRRETLGDYTAELNIDGSSASLRWFKDGKLLKSAPAAAKKEHPEEFKDLQGTLKDINAMLPAQRERIDSLFLAQKSWPLPVWRERYLDHPLVGTIARRLIWSFAGSGSAARGRPHAEREAYGNAIWHDGALVGVDGKPLKLSDSATVSLWHPIGRPTDEILAWRDWLERSGVVQPFKQAHREVYILTDAERRTATYSNRFAAHVIRQHQFNALCAARGWKNKLRLMVDDTYPPTYRELPAWGLRADYWVEGIGDEYGRDTNESGVYLRLVTDQVRFYRLSAPQLRAHATGGGYGRHGAAEEPLPLDQVPPLVLSEIMRDVDLFVGVASVGNDPNWADGGPEGRYRDYWQSYSFGELSATAQTRRALLERLVPRLKIASRCILSDRFLIVRGELRTYKIHLGSGNILMEPNDQYLCIVPKQATAGGERVLLPFEGDGTLSIVLSKAFLLADDAKITDPTITSQLKR